MSYCWYYVGVDYESVFVMLRTKQDIYKQARRILDRLGMKQVKLEITNVRSYTACALPDNKIIRISYRWFRQRSREYLRGVIIHEVAHLYVPAYQHNEIFQTIASILGAPAWALFPSSNGRWVDHEYSKLARQYSKRKGRKADDTRRV